MKKDWQSVVRNGTSNHSKSISSPRCETPEKPFAPLSGRYLLRRAPLVVAQRNAQTQRPANDSLSTSRPMHFVRFCGLFVCLSISTVIWSDVGGDGRWGAGLCGGIWSAGGEKMTGSKTCGPLFVDADSHLASSWLRWAVGV